MAASRIPPQDFADLVEELKPILDGSGEFTSFEALTAMAFFYFARQKVDLAVIEVGLGGRVDATNAIHSPWVSIITPISFEHTQVLGNTLAQIAREKAGIIKPGATTVCAPQEKEAREVIEAVARRQGSPLRPVEDIWQWERKELALSGQTIDLFPRREEFERGGYVPLKDLFLPLLGLHQISNSATAITALIALKEKGVSWDEKALRAGLAAVEWPARAEILSRRPFVLVDGAHNGASAVALRALLDDLRQSALIQAGSFWLVLGIMSDKNLEAILRPFAGLISGLVLTQADNPRSVPAEKLKERVVGAQIFGEATAVVSAPNVGEAAATALQNAGDAGAILATGSLFIAAEARSAFQALLASRSAKAG